MKKQWLIHDVQLKYQKTAIPTEQITSSETAAKICRTTIPDDQIGHREFFSLLLLNRGNRVLRTCIISIGGINMVVVDPKVIMQCALLANATSVVLCHNHPSGTVTPSEQDLRLTKRIGEACDVMDMTLLDHIILSAYENATPNYFSFADNGLI